MADMPDSTQGGQPTDGLKREPSPKVSGLLADLHAKKEAARNARSGWEQVAIEALRAYRDQDNSKFRESEHTNVSLRTSKVKTRAAQAQIKQALFGSGKFPLELKETKVPVGIPKYVHISEGGQQTAPEMANPSVSNESKELYLPGSIGFSGDGRTLKAGATFSSMFDAPVEPETVDKAIEEGAITQGVGKMGEPTISPAQQAAYKLNMAVHDQLDAANVIAELEKFIDELCIIGTSVLKGPFNVYKEIPFWKKMEDGSRAYEPKKMLTPKCEFVSIWDFFPDPSASCMEDAEWAIQRHKMTETQVRGLKRRPLFDSRAIDELIHDGPNYTSQMGNDEEIEDPRLHVDSARHTSLYEIYEYWGYLSVDKVREFGLPVPEEADEVVQVNVWFSGNNLLRISLNPFEPCRIPYYMAQYETDPYSLYGVGVPTSMADQQRMINGFLRMAIDNLALAGNMVFDVDETMLVPGQPMEIQPGQIFKRLGGQPGQAVYGIKFPNTANENLQMVQEMRRQADEATGIPSIAHGQTGVSSTGRTASGMSMILNNASLNIKEVVRNIDRNVLKPLGQAMFAWNMQFNAAAHPDIEGDIEVIAKGSSSLEAKDVENQRLSTFLQLSANPALAPLIKLPNIVKKLALTMDMEPDEVLNSPEEAQFYALLMGLQNASAQKGTPDAQGGSVGTPAPGQQGFTGNDLSGGNPEGFNGNVPGTNAPQG